MHMGLYLGRLNRKQSSVNDGSADGLADMSARRIFLGVSKLGSVETEVLQRGPGAEPLLRSAGDEMF